MAALAYPVRFREGRRSDHALVFSSWIQNERVRFPNSSLPKAEFCSRLRPAIETVLARGRLTIAHDASDADHIYGYLVHEVVPLTWANKRDESPEDAIVLHYLYVKGPFRRHGFAERLVRHAVPEFGKRTVYTTAMTHHRQPSLRDDKGEPIGVVDGEHKRQAWHRTAQEHRLVYLPLFVYPRAPGKQGEAA